MRPREPGRAAWAEHSWASPTRSTGPRFCRRSPDPSGEVFSNPGLSARRNSRRGLLSRPADGALPPVSRITPLRDSVLPDGRRSQRLRPRARPAASSRATIRPFETWSTDTTPASTRCPTASSATPEDAEEATQDTFLTLYRKIGTFDESKKFFSWFYRVALNYRLQRARRRKPVRLDGLARGLPAAFRRRRPARAPPTFTAWVDGTENDAHRPRPRRASRGLHRRAAADVPGRDLDGRRRGDEAGRRGRDPRDLRCRP